VLKNISTATNFVDEYPDYEWLPHLGSPQTVHYRDHNTVHFQIFDRAPDYVNKTARENFVVFSTSMIKQNPGMVFPLHSDTYYKFKQTHRVTGDIVRWCIFLQDWQPGHYFDMNQQPIVNWKKGDYVELKEGDLHRGSNSGNVPKYTAQITGVLKN
tara:strand:- start:111 stop:578 length:468 start_codon:yes stop_codon:yes gene_type:complete